MWPGFISVSDADDVLFRSNPMPPIDLLFEFLVVDVVMSVELSFSWYSMGSSWMILWSTIPRMSILYLIKSVYEFFFLAFIANSSYIHY